MALELIESWRFRVEGLSGYISGGHEHGLELTAGAKAQPLTRPMCMNVEHYYARGRRGGRFVPRYKAEVETSQVGQDAVRVTIAPYQDWRVTTMATYRVIPDRTVEAVYEFVFEEDCGAFEALISNYFHEPTEPWVHAGGAWVRPQLGEREHRTWMRSEQDSRNYRDGRHEDFMAEVKNDYLLSIDDKFYDYPVMVSEIGDSGWSIVHVIDRQVCPSISANRTWNAHDFSLVGRDVQKGETVVCRARMAYTRLGALDDALKLAEELTGRAE
jgi:hypothetical protein